MLFFFSIYFDIGDNSTNQERNTSADSGMCSGLFNVMRHLFPVYEPFTKGLMEIPISVVHINFPYAEQFVL